MTSAFRSSCAATRRPALGYVGDPSRLGDEPLAGMASWGTPGEIFADKYLVDGVLGAGGMGRVLSARHIDLDRRVAIKVIGAEWARDADSSERLVREARAAASLTSNNIACVYDLGRTPNGLPFIVMEHLVGMDLGGLVMRGRIPWRDAVQYMLQALGALEEAHAQGIIHRDIKPQNLFLTSGNLGEPLIKVLDFGLAKNISTAEANAESKLTGMHMMLGSPRFMSPEQIRDARAVDARSDVWSVGATLYLLITGRHPFVAPSAHVVCAKILSEPAESMRRHRPDIPVEVDRVVLRCMSRDPDARFPTARSLADALRGSISGLDRVRALVALPSFGSVVITEARSDAALAMVSDRPRARVTRVPPAASPPAAPLRSCQSPPMPAPGSARTAPPRTEIPSEAATSLPDRLRLDVPRVPVPASAIQDAERTIARPISVHRSTLRAAEVPVARAAPDEAKGRRLSARGWRVGAVFAIGAFAAVVASMGVAGIGSMGGEEPSGALGPVVAVVESSELTIDRDAGGAGR